MRPPTGNTSTVMRFQWTCCVRELLISHKSTRRMLRCDHWAAVSVLINLESVKCFLMMAHWNVTVIVHSCAAVACRYDCYWHRRGVRPPGIQMRPCGLLLRLQGHRRWSEADRSHKLPGEESEKETGLDLCANY